MFLKEKFFCFILWLKKQHISKKNIRQCTFCSSVELNINFHLRFSIRKQLGTVKIMISIISSIYIIEKKIEKLFSYTWKIRRLLYVKYKVKDD